jgi:hypothetical protein
MAEARYFGALQRQAVGLLGIEFDHNMTNAVHGYLPLDWTWRH